MFEFDEGVGELVRQDHEREEIRRRAWEQKRRLQRWQNFALTLVVLLLLGAIAWKITV